MSGYEFIDIKKRILRDNDGLAAFIRAQMIEKKSFMLDLMASPGSGKTSLILETVERLNGIDKRKIAVIEGDIESAVDSESIASAGIQAIQLRTGGACHLDAAMVNEALMALKQDTYELIFVENVGNLVCPAEFDIGEDIKVMILSVPEGDDKVVKYPLMFTVCDVLLVNKIDCLDRFDFDLDDLSKKTRSINPHIEIFPVSCKTGEGLDEWCNWLEKKVTQKI